jgi:hypothetical protein
MTRLFCILLTLLFSLSGPSMAECGDFSHLGIAAKTTPTFSGTVRSVRPETGGPKVHYIFDANGNFTGTR